MTRAEQLTADAVDVQSRHSLTFFEVGQEDLGPLNIEISAAGGRLDRRASSHRVEYEDVFHVGEDNLRRFLIEYRLQRGEEDLQARKCQREVASQKR